MRSCSTVPLYRLLTIFEWLQLNEIFYSASTQYYLTMFVDLFLNSKYSLNNQLFFVLGTWNFFAISIVPLYRLNYLRGARAKSYFLYIQLPLTNTSQRFSIYLEIRNVFFFKLSCLNVYIFLHFVHYSKLHKLYIKYSISNR